MSRSGARLSGRKSSQTVDISKYASKDLTELRKLREVEVENLNFEEVQVIDAAIQSRDFDNTQSVIESLTTSLLQTVDRVFTDYEAGVNAQVQAANAAILAAREETNKKFAETQARHIAEIADLEDARQLDTGLHQNRPSAKGIELKKVAKGLARGKKVEEAIATRNEAVSIEQKELEARAAAVNMSYGARLQVLLAQLTLELDQLQNLLTARIDGIELKKSQAIDLIKRSTAAVIREDLRKRIASGHVKLTKKERADEVSNVLTARVQKRITEDNRGFIFDTTGP